MLEDLCDFRASGWKGGKNAAKAVLRKAKEEFKVKVRWPFCVDLFILFSRVKGIATNPDRSRNAAGKAAQGEQEQWNVVKKNTAKKEGKVCLFLCWSRRFFTHLCKKGE